MSLSARAVLVARGGPNENQSFPLGEGATTLGRAATNNVIVDEDGISRQHAQIVGDEHGFWLFDMNSRNGTFVNDTKIGVEPHRLRNWDHIELGGSTYYWIFQEEQGTVSVPRAKVRP